MEKVNAFDFEFSKIFNDGVEKGFNKCKKEYFYRVRDLLKQNREQMELINDQNKIINTQRKTIFELKPLSPAVLIESINRIEQTLNRLTYHLTGSEMK